ncbi:hypothetical protein AX774_g7422 [Zancudomyces culisetae]|uniref:Uncharacterized protein n=1 Tax=Zancudomyces culisetae TaxID=1213189 RepID=A0A1R1PCW0_ZANCU|nr:hypothetical protein AX774_g7800 [Zancudomyces culisetae]OMH79179.1 hypothetical protein AX774_g7422 [Zancudomyces culisetae]|eukprot:OMH78805.1 hypothetical protein AX774_g7800 [Zancudomyces culisetae]
MSSRFSTQFKRHWIKKEAYPIVGIMALGVSFATFHGIRQLTKQDIVINHKKNPTPYMNVSKDSKPTYIVVDEPRHYTH